MITYELMLLLRMMPKVETRSTLKRIAISILDKPGIIRKIENLGTHETPYKISNHDMIHKSASYYLMEFNVPPYAVDDLLEEFSRDIDIVRRRIYKKREPAPVNCTLEDELQPPPYRKDVQELIAEARKLDKPKFKYNSGLDYYPFQK